ncbi:serine threonine kinase protein [Rutstroemia sp. NJR-2017a BBW]|nr:serine threonine kinase protein [Rutstroemia sp. NJR-2017a BBW]
MLQQENPDSLTTNIPFGGLPPMIQDAIFITHSVDLRYLWVDALCIIQNDSKDTGDELRIYYEYLSSELYKSGQDREYY